jgi:hypothetical protein
MRVWSIYTLETGLFTGRISRASKLGRTPTGLAAIEGLYDRRSQRVVLETGSIVDYARSKTEVEAEQHATRALHSRRVIYEHEHTQARVVREALLSMLPDGPEKQRLQQIEDEIAARRAEI